MRPAISLLFDNASHADGARILFTNPVGEIRAHRIGDVAQALRRADAEIAAGRWVAGYLSYELGYALEPKVAGLMPARPGPLIRLFVFDGPQPAPPAQAYGTCTARVLNPKAHWRAYAEAFDRAHRYILDGDIYQVNLTFPLEVAVEGDCAALYTRLRREARAGASVFLRMGDEDILSFSPETFFTVRNDRITTRPMKGTAPRGLTPAADEQAKRALRADPKERAENLMIVDLLRNDLARVANPGSVRVTDLFTVETFPRLHTMTSGVTAELRAGVVLSDILRALFPCGSITGAPKIRAMEIVRELEEAPRGPYCGAIGFAGPGADGTGIAAFNVAIRTLIIRSGRAVFPVGSGVVADSTAEREFAECLLKARFLSQSTPEINLIETARWSRDGGLMLEAEHDERLKQSAAYFGFSYSPLAAAAAWELAADDAGSDSARVRLEVQPDGGVIAHGVPLAPSPGAHVWRYTIADARIHSGDTSRHHKTTDRAIYDETLVVVRAQGFDEAIFLNERDEVVEGAISNVFVQIDGELVTPPLSSGALNGCVRRAALELWPSLAERTLTLEDLHRADAVWFANSVRGFIRGVRG